ncbi:DUF3558 domain-containing protein [Rhodococcoides kyotonense]|uniref:DUF3558 domain-containing protein n=1 Tax=Rhodococcoides kyotonense TaxID=398843 RepID=A0A239HBR2_9NOCA|nr:DUF3558 domain-containing protein [Rhodococcus kyotonensis]SNS78817.1 hypothetical protein SAMN05421642_105188 [Rhodococcus kyotonensis]
MRLRQFALPALATAALLVGSCSQQEVTYTVNGEEVEPNTPSGDAADVDPCSVVSDSVLQQLELADVEPFELPQPNGGCEWDGGNTYTKPNLTLWVSGQTEADPHDEMVDVAGVPVNVYSIAGTSGRLIAYFDDLTLSLNYKTGQAAIGTEEALRLAMTDVLAGYSRS